MHVLKTYSGIARVYKLGGIKGASKFSTGANKGERVAVMGVSYPTTSRKVRTRALVGPHFANSWPRAYGARHIIYQKQFRTYGAPEKHAILYQKRPKNTHFYISYQNISKSMLDPQHGLGTGCMHDGNNVPERTNLCIDNIWIYFCLEPKARAKNLRFSARF